MIIEFPCMRPQMVPISKVVANDWNPNKMESKMFRLLKHSIVTDGLTMPIVTYYNSEDDTYVIVDGFHRYTVLLKLHVPNIPVSIIDKPIEERMMSTIRHNKAKGTHQLALMRTLFSRLKEKLSLAKIAEGMGMEAEEVVIYSRGSSVAKDTGENVEFSNSWERNPEDKILYKNKKHNEYEQD
jgi:ParB-like chromosome segregation protein Spo0J